MRMNPILGNDGVSLKNEHLARLGILHEPAGYVDGGNRYQYVKGNPISNLDYSGLDTISELEEELRLLEKAKDYDYSQHSGQPSPDSEYLWNEIQKVKSLINTYKGKVSDGSYITTVAAGTGLAEETFISGKTFVRINGTEFYMTGTPQPGMWTPKTGSTSSFFIYKKADPNKLYRLDWDTLKQGAQKGQKGWEHNQNGVAKILDLAVSNHQPAGFWGKTAGKAVTVFKYGGKALFFVGMALTAYDIYKAENKKREIAAQIGGWAGALIGAELGAEGGAWAGAGIGGVITGGPGAAPGAGIGGVIGAVGGGIGGYIGGRKLVTTVYDWIFTPMEKEEYVVVEGECADSIS